MAETYHIPWYTHLARGVLRLAFGLLFHILSPIRITGIENIPKQGAYLIAINHVSLYEAPFLLSFWPQVPETVGAVEIWERPGQAILVRLYRGIPVHRGEYDRKLLETMIAVLQSGRPMLIAPEGGRSHQPGMHQAMPGVAYIMDKTGVPVVPVGIVGTTRDYAARAFRGKRPPLEMHIGAPFHLPKVESKGNERRAALQENADLIMRRVADMLPPDYRGLYG